MMSDRDMLAYSLIVIAALVYGAALLRWWYMSPVRVYARRERKQTERYDARLAAKANVTGADRGGSHD